MKAFTKIYMNNIPITRPSSDSEAATMYKLKGRSSNMRTGKSFENKLGLSCAKLKLSYVKVDFVVKLERKL